MNLHIETVTPERANEILAKNTGNRPANQQHIDFLASQMKAGVFVVTGQTIQIADSGKLLDGQHRLMALVAAGISMDFAIATGLPESIFSKLDQGKKRGADDVLAIAGFANTSIRAALVAKLIHFEAGRIGTSKGNTGSGTKVSADEILAYAQAHDLERAISDGSVYHLQSNILTRKAWAFASELLHRISPEEAGPFLTQLATGANLEKNDVVLFVRNRIIRSLTSLSDTLTESVRLEYVFRAWNRVRDGRRAGMIKIISGETEIPR